MDKAVMSVRQMAEQMGISRPKAYELVKEPGFPTIRVETQILIPMDAFKEWLVIHAVYQRGEIQRCIVHQIRYTTKFISYKDLKPFMKDLKQVYKADTEELALSAMDVPEENWGRKYPAFIASWRNNWPQLSTYLKYPTEIRKLHEIKNNHPTDDALFKILYPAMMDATKKWTGKTWYWGGRRLISCALISEIEFIPRI